MPIEKLAASEVVVSYKKLAWFEEAFRNLKTVSFGREPFSVEIIREKHLDLRKHVNPTGSRSYMASYDPEFEEKLADIIGLYLKPPMHAAVCVDEKDEVRSIVVELL